TRRTARECRTPIHDVSCPAAELAPRGGTRRLSDPICPGGVGTGRIALEAKEGHVRKVLIANRGGIAVRIAPACPDEGLASVAVYAAPDRAAAHVLAADEAMPLDGSTPAETYLDMDRVLRAAVAAGADAVHPGYGFLAESAGFAQAVLDAGLTWIGPPPAVIRRLGDKRSARQAARRAGAPLLPGMAAPATEIAEVSAFARGNGFPLVIKTPSGGGGKSVAVVRSAGELARSYTRVMRSAAAAGG